MKRLLFLLCIVLSSPSLYCQDKIDFSGLAPSSLDQYRGTCYAYATTYTAMTIKLAVKKGISSIQDSNVNAFSPAFTASRIQRKKSILKRLFTSCSVGGNIEKAAEILVQDGALPITTQFCCYSIPEKEFTVAGNYKIQDYTTIITGDDPRTDVDGLFTSMKQYLLQKEPVICAIRQTEAFQNNTEFDYHISEATDAKNNYKESNHAICVVGFDDGRNGGSFLIKNNYRSFGNYGLAWITYKDFVKYLSYAIVLGDFVSPALPAVRKYDPAEIYR